MSRRLASERCGVAHLLRDANKLLSNINTVHVVTALEATVSRPLPKKLLLRKGVSPLASRLPRETSFASAFPEAACVDTHSRNPRGIPAYL